MTLSKHWAYKHSLNLLQLKQLEMERIQEQLLEQQTRALFDSIKRDQEDLTLLEKAHDEYVGSIEGRIIDGWRPNAAEWAGIEISLKVFAKRRKELTDPLGISEIAKKLAAKREHSLFDRYMADLALFSNEADEVEDEGVIVRESNVEDYSDEPFDSTNEPRCKTCEQIYTECSCKEFGA